MSEYKSVVKQLIESSGLFSDKETILMDMAETASSMIPEMKYIHGLLVRFIEDEEEFGINNPAITLKEFEEHLEKYKELTEKLKDVMVGI